MNALGAIGEGLAEIAINERNADLTLGIGGDASNVCVMAVRAGAKARLIGRVGNDRIGRRLTAFWGEIGVGLSEVSTDTDAPTGLYINETDPDLGHSFTHWRKGSAGSRLSPDDLRPEALHGLGTLLFTGVTLAVSPSSANAVHAAISQARRLGIPVACLLNHRPALGADPAELINTATASDLVLGSMDDLELLFGSRQAGLDHFLGRGRDVPAELVLTDGAQPARVWTRNELVRQPVPPSEVRDAAGAGDAFAGAFLASRLRGAPHSTALAWGVAAATLSVGGLGCALSYPSGEETAALAARLPRQERVGADARTVACP